MWRDSDKMNVFNNTADNTLKNRTTNVWGPGTNYDTKIGRVTRLAGSGEGKPHINTGFNTQPYMASSPSYLPNMAAISDKSIHDDFRVNYGVQIPHAYLEKPYVGFSGSNYKFMKNRKPIGLAPNPVEAAGAAMVVAQAAASPEETGYWIQCFNQNHWQSVAVELVAGWAQHFDNDDWEVDNKCVWSGSYWIMDISGGVSDEARLVVKTGATWQENYEPTKIRLTFNPDYTIYYWLDTANYGIGWGSMESGGEDDISSVEGEDIWRLRIRTGNSEINLTNIEFFGGGDVLVANIAWESTTNQWTWTASSGAIKVHDESNWARKFQPKKIRFTIVGDGNTQTIYLRDINSNNIMIKDITPPDGVATKYVFDLAWHKAGDIDTFGFTTSNTVSIRNIEFFAVLTDERRSKLIEGERLGLGGKGTSVKKGISVFPPHLM